MCGVCECMCEHVCVVCVSVCVSMCVWCVRVWVVSMEAPLKDLIICV